MFVPLNLPFPNQQTDGFTLEFLLEGPQTELRTLSQNYEQTLQKLRTNRIMNKRAFLNFWGSEMYLKIVLVRPQSWSRLRPMYSSTIAAVREMIAKSIHRMNMGGGVSQNDGGRGLWCCAWAYFLDSRWPCMATCVPQMSRHDGLLWRLDIAHLLIYWAHQLPEYRCERILDQPCGVWGPDAGRNLREISCGQFPFKLKDENQRNISPKFRSVFSSVSLKISSKFSPEFRSGRLWAWHIGDAPEQFKSRYV